ncbi:hypothetical protein JCM10020v2_003168 [Rhodotorula toruloides]
MLTRHTDRTRYGQEDEDIAYRLQIIGAREGAIRGTLVAGAAVALWGFSSSRSSKKRTDHYLLKWEQDHRIQAERWRDMARRELSAKGIIASETTMQKWKADFDLKNSSSAVLSPATSTSPAPQVGESRTLEELRQVQA